MNRQVTIYYVGVVNKQKLFEVIDIITFIGLFMGTKEDCKKFVESMPE